MLEALFTDTAFWVKFFGIAAVVLQLALTVGVILRVILTRHPPGSSFAWILLTVALPYVGFFLYVMLGERPIGRWRAYKLKKILSTWESVSHQKTSRAKMPVGQRHKGLIRLAQRLGDMPMTEGSLLELLPDSEHALKRMLEDVNNARKSVSMEFYIWDLGGACDEMAQAVMSAAQRGVVCRVLVDDIGSRKFLRSAWPKRMRQAGVHVNSALPVSLFPLTKGRADLRLHRKTVIIDDTIGYTGSLNMIDPTLFNANEGVGEWVDAMVRIQGASVADLNQIFALDWALQPDDEGHMPELLPIPETAPKGHACVTVLGSGPTTVDDANRRLIIEAINCARNRIYITTPYFVPDEAMVIALQNAAMRGVEVRLCIPKVCDSLWVRYASRRYFGVLLDSGVKILLFTDGILHTKAVTVDNDFSLFGTVNLDSRSLHLNFEMMLLIFDREFVQMLSILQYTYEKLAEPVDAKTWHQRPVWERFKEGICHLLSPLL